MADNSIAERLGANIRALRTMKDWSLRDLSAQVNLTISSLSEIERGIQNTSVITLVVLAKVFDVSTDDLLNADYIPCPDCDTCLTCGGKRYIKASEVKSNGRH